MFKKSLYLGSVTLILLALIALAGCSNPASDGPAGAPGRESKTGAITKVQLKELFEVNDTVQLLTAIGGPTEVTGVVPYGKTLEISGMVNIDTGGLEVNGLLHIKEDGELNDANGRFSVGRTGRVILEGYVYPEQDLFLNQPIADERNNGKVEFDPQVVVLPLGEKAGLLLPDSVEPVGVSKYFEKVDYLKWARETNPLNETSIADLDNWVPGKTLTLNATTNPITTDTDIILKDGKGTLIIDGVPGTSADLQLGTGTAGYLLDARDAQILVGKNGRITLSHDNSGLAVDPLGNITIKGELAAGATTPTRKIPASVDLKEATLLATVSSGVLYFDEEKYEIGRVDLPQPLVLKESRGLTIGSVGNVVTGGGVPLTIPPAETTTIYEVISDADAVTITSDPGTTTSQYAILRVGSVTGNAGLAISTTTPFLYLKPLVDDIDTVISAANSVITADIADLGGPLPEEQSEVIGKIRGGTLNLGSNIMINEAITINTALTSGGTLEIAADTTFNVSPDVAGVITIDEGKNLILASEVKIERTNLTLTEGVYQASDDDVEILANGNVKTAATQNAGLKIGKSVADIGANYVALTSNNTTGATFTPSAAMVQFGQNGILIPGGSAAGAILTADANARIIVAGTDPTIGITLGYDVSANSGTLDLTYGAILATTADPAGYTASSTPPVGSYATAAQFSRNDTTTNMEITVGTDPADAVITSATTSRP